jgi:hypothetical protein
MFIILRPWFLALHTDALRIGDEELEKAEDKDLNLMSDSEKMIRRDSSG